MLIKIVFTVLSMLFSSLAIAETVWIDVRTALEHRIDSIEGDTRISHTQILPEISKLYADRNTEIRLYCRSGVRSEKAVSDLIQAGYTNVSNAGGIDDARKARGLVDSGNSSE